MEEEKKKMHRLQALIENVSAFEIDLTKPGRTLIEMQEVSELRKKKLRDVKLHLFNDMILIAKIVDEKKLTMVRPQLVLCVSCFIGLLIKLCGLLFVYVVRLVYFRSWPQSHRLACDTQGHDEEHQSHYYR